MNKRLILLCILFISLQVQSQIKKIYGYKQEITGGAMQVSNAIKNKSGNEIPIRTVNTRYFLFVEIENKNIVFPQQLWINKKQYNYTTDTVKNFPFVLISSDGGDRISRDTLIKSFNGIVIQLKNAVAAKQQKISNSIKNKIQENSIVFTYRYNKKMYTSVLKKIKELTPIFTP